MTKDKEDMAPRYHRVGNRFKRRRVSGGAGRFKANQLNLKATAGPRWDGEPDENPLFDRLCRYETLKLAWGLLRKGRTAVSRKAVGAADRISLELYERSLEANLRRLSYELRSGRYRPGPINMFQLPKPGGGHRTLTVLTVKDRVAQKAATMLLEELWEPLFLSCSFAFRPATSVQDALREVERGYTERLRWVADADIESFFDMIPRNHLAQLLSTRISDQRMLALLELWLDQIPSQKAYLYTNSTQPEQRVTENEPARSRKVIPSPKRLLETGLDWGIERLHESDAYGNGESLSYQPYRGGWKLDDEENETADWPDPARPGKPLAGNLPEKALRRFGMDGATLGLSLARQALKHGLPHLPGGLGLAGAALGVGGAVGFWALHQRKRPTLYEVETAHFRQEQSQANGPTGRNFLGSYPSDLLEDGKVGIAQGSILSPLFSNIYLHEFDRQLTWSGYQLVRYADDLVILCRTQREAFKALEEAERVLAGLGLRFKTAKTRVTPLTEGFHFLGAEFGPDGHWKKLPGLEQTESSPPPRLDRHEAAGNGWLSLAARLKPGLAPRGHPKTEK